MSRRLCAALALLSAFAGLAVAFGPWPLPTAGGVLLAFLLPGLALTNALFRDRVSLTMIEKCVLVPAMSLATLVLGGLAAWGMGFELHRWTWLAISELATLAALGTTIVRPIPQGEPKRRRGVKHAKLPTPRDQTLILPFFSDRAYGFDAEPRWWRKLIPARPHRNLIPLLLAIGLLTGSGWYSVHQSRLVHEVRVTSLSATVPSAADELGERTIRVTATGLPAFSRGAYELLVSTPDGLSSDRRPVHADADGRWTAKLTVQGGERTTLALYAAGVTVPARTVIIAAG